MSLTRIQLCCKLYPEDANESCQSLIAPTSTPEREARAFVDPGMQCNPQHSPALQAQEAEAQELSHVSAECQKCLNAFHVSRHFCFRDIVHRNLLAAICKRNDSQDFRFQGCWLSSWLRIYTNDQKCEKPSKTPCKTCLRMWHCHTSLYRQCKIVVQTSRPSWMWEWKLNEG